MGGLSAKHRGNRKREKGPNNGQVVLLIFPFKANPKQQLPSQKGTLGDAEASNAFGIWGLKRAYGVCSNKGPQNGSSFGVPKRTHPKRVPTKKTTTISMRRQRAPAGHTETTGSGATECSCRKIGFGPIGGLEPNLDCVLLPC